MIVESVGFRQMSAMGNFLIAVGLFGSSFVTDINLFYFTYSVVIGMYLQNIVNHSLAVFF